MGERPNSDKLKVWRPLDLVRVTASFFESHGVDAPRLCAERLLAYVLGCERIDLYTRFERPVAPDKLSQYRNLVRRRAAREPIQHLVGSTEFWSLAIRCDGRAMVPRPETELIVQTALDLTQGNETPAIADIGTGTGCIAIALASELKEARIVASDISPDALELAAENLEAHSLAERVPLLEGDLAAPFTARGMNGQFDIVLSNPPYVSELELAQAQPEVRDHDPRIALDGGADGFDVVRRLINETSPLLRPAGFLILELGENQAGAAREMMVGAGWNAVRTLADGAGIERVIVGRRGADG